MILPIFGYGAEDVHLGNQLLLLLELGVVLVLELWQVQHL